MLESRAGIRATKHDFHVVRGQRGREKELISRGASLGIGGGSGDKAADRGGELPRGVGEKAVISSSGNSRKWW